MKFPKRNPQAKKGDSGKVAIIGGDPYIHGAPILAALGALATGVDLIRIYIPKKHAEVTRMQNTNFIVYEFTSDSFTPKDSKNIFKELSLWADSVVIGCGFTEKEKQAVCEFLKIYTGNIIIDAGALQPEILKYIHGRGNILLTPHSGEFERLFEISATPKNVQKMTKKYDITIARKGMIDIVANTKEIREIHAGCPEMAVGGTGDALAGICGGFLARGMSPFEAAALACKSWGKTGEDLAQKKRVFSAEEMIDEFRAMVPKK